MANEKDIIQAIAEHLTLAPEDVEKDAGLREDLSLGPIELNDLLNVLATKFDITFNPEDIEDLHTVEDLVSLVEDNLIE